MVEHQFIKWRNDMKKKFLFIVFSILLICLVPRIEKCKCGGTTYISLVYRIEKANINLSGIYAYSVDVFGINVYNSILTVDKE